MDCWLVYFRKEVAGHRKAPRALLAAGATENTTTEVGDPVSIEGQALPKGIYDLHMIPTADAWTLIFSQIFTARGGFTYNQPVDALRVTVKPRPAEMHEAWTYDFDDVKADSAVVTMRWEMLAVPFTVKADHQATLANIRNQLRNGPQYLWNGWGDAATWCVANDRRQLQTQKDKAKAVAVYRSIAKHFPEH